MVFIEWAKVGVELTIAMYAVPRYGIDEDRSDQM